MRRHLLTALLLLAAALLLPAAAQARGKDRNHDRIPDRWERAHHLSLKVKQARKDQDHDGLNNLGEFKAGDDPRDADSDNDGTEDGDEQAGTIDAIDGTLVTIRLLDGSLVSAQLTDGTEVECETRDDDGDVAPTARKSDDGEGEHEGSDDGEDHSGPSGDDGAEDQGDDHGEDGRAEHGCPAGALKVGARVHEAELKVTSAGKVWEEIELVV
jgi:hypothetical protein